MKKVRFREQRSMRAISRRFRRMNENNIQRSNNRRIESTSSLFTTTRRMSREVWEKDDCKIASWRTTKRDENILNRRRDKEMHTHWAFHIQSHWTSSWDRIWSQIEELFMTSSKARTVNLISIFKILSNFAKFIQKTVKWTVSLVSISILWIFLIDFLFIIWYINIIFISIQQTVMQSIISHFIIQTITHFITHIISLNSSFSAKSTRRTVRWSVRWTIRWTVRWTIRKSINRQTIISHHWKFEASRWIAKWTVSNRIIS